MISVVIPAFREAERIGSTLAGVQVGARMLQEPLEVIVVDDGSDDGTAEQVLAHRWVAGVRLVQLERNQGKGAALASGLLQARGEWIVMLDADLGATAAQFPRLVVPVQSDEADMTIALFPGRTRQMAGPGSAGVLARPLSPDAGGDARAPRTGFGLAMRTARWGVARLTGRVLKAPLSGQRAFAAANLPLLLPLEPGFGLEVGLDVDALHAGLRVLEVPTLMAHAATSRDWTGFRHRGLQMAHILRALARRARGGRRRLRTERKLRERAGSSRRTGGQ
jgi:glycosyltransferase involved in cell wall biosynthesis